MPFIVVGIAELFFAFGKSVIIERLAPLFSHYQSFSENFGILCRKKSIFGPPTMAVVLF